MTGILVVLKSGEEPRTWDTEDLASVADVRAKFDEIVGSGGTALAEGQRLKEFDETKPEIHAIPQFQGG